MTTQKKNSRLSARAILRQMFCLFMALTVVLPASFAAAEDEVHALHKAVLEADRAEVKRLLAAGADANASDVDGVAPLLYAVSVGDVKIIADLLAAGGSVNAADEEPETSLLHWGARLDYPDVIDILVENGADVNRQNEEGKTALHWAAEYGRPAAVRALIKGGADVNLADNEEFTPLLAATWENHYIVMAILIDNAADLHRANENGDTPLHDAAYYGHIESVELLIEAGADANRRNNDGQTPLFYAQQQGHTEIADMLLLIVAADYDFPPKPEKESASERVYEKVWQSIVHISDTEGEGSGVIVARETVVTNCHVIEGGGDIVVRKARERRIVEEGDEYPAEYSNGDFDLDFCILHVPGLDGVPVKIRRYKTLRVGEDVYAVGNPHGDWDLSLSAGIISQLREDGGAREIQTDAAISPGSSGGGLFDEDGNLVGITTAFSSEEMSQNLNLAVPADWFFGY